VKGRRPATGLETRPPPALWLGLAILALACASASPAGPSRYRLTEGSDWRRSGEDEVLADLEPRYPEFFAVVLDPRRAQDPEIRKVRADLESQTLGRERFDALNAVAVAYYELNARAQRSLTSQDGGATYLADSFRATKLLSIPWRAYGDVRDPALRQAILDFYADIANGRKLYASETAPRILGLVGSLAKKEDDPSRLTTIRALEEKLEKFQTAEL
jgi:hypothetical protein